MRTLLSLLLLIIPHSLFSNETFIDGVFMHPVSRYFDMDMEANNDEYALENDLVEDIIEIVSGMIYGWRFEYIPSDIKRQIDEVFTIEPIGLIKKGDPGMFFRDNWVKDHIMYQNIVYRLSDYQKKYIKSWKTSVIPDSYGEGAYSIYKEDGKSQSLKEAIKDSIKREFQSRGKDKPRSIRGQILLKENPRLFINAGLFKTQVETLILYKDIREYRYH